MSYCPTNRTTFLANSSKCEYRAPKCDGTDASLFPRTNNTAIWRTKLFRPSFKGLRKTKYGS